MAGIIDDASVSALARSVRAVLSQEGMGVLRNAGRFYSFLSDNYGDTNSPEMAILSRALPRDDSMGLFAEFAQLDCGSSKDDVVRAVERAAQRMVRDCGAREEDAYACATALGLGIARSLGVEMPDAKTLLAKDGGESDKEPDVAQKPKKKTGKTKSANAGESGSGTVEDGKKTTEAQQSEAGAAQGNGLGSEGFNSCIVDWLVDKFQADNVIDLRSDWMAMERLKAASVKAEKDLLESAQTSINLSFITTNEKGPLHLDYTLTSDEYERISKNSKKGKTKTGKSATKKTSNKTSRPSL